MPSAARQPPKITPAKIRQWVGPTYAQRGQSYYRGGHIVDLRWRGETLHGRVQGTEDQPYRVAITFGRGGMEGECSCPLGFNCKHVAALLYALAEAPAAAPHGPPLEQALEGLDREALLGLINEMLDEAPELEDLAEAYAVTRALAQRAAQAGPEVDGAAAAGQAARALLRRAQNRSQFESALRGLAGLLERGRALAKDQEREAALAVERAVLNEILLAGLATAFDPNALGQVARQAAEAILQDWRGLPPASPARSEALRALFDLLAWQIHTGWTVDARGRVAKALAEQARPAEREHLREWIALARRAGSSRRPGRWTLVEGARSADPNGELEDADLAGDEEYGAAWAEPAEAWADLESLFDAPAPRAKPARKAARPRRTAGR